MSNAHLDSKKELTLRDFSFELPESLIAQRPLPQRDGAKCLVWKDQTILHSHIKDLTSHISDNSLIIVNDSRVIASRIRFTLETGAKGEFLLLEPSTEGGQEIWTALARPTKRLKAGQRVALGFDLTATIQSVPKSHELGPEPITVSFSLKGDAFSSWLEKHAEMPLPPYIERRDADDATKSEDKIRYQTVYSKPEGSVAAPTAGLHFTPEVMGKLKDKGCTFASTTLHVGAGTFLPVKSEKIDLHRMHSERFLVPRETLAQISKAQNESQKIIVVGTTAFRGLEGLKKISLERKTSLESLADTWQRTEIFIRPKFKEDRYKSWCAHALMTNFHQPESTLYMLISSLVGYENAAKIYQEAMSKQYRFFSYGDSSLLWL